MTLADRLEAAVAKIEEHAEDLGRPRIRSWMDMANDQVLTITPDGIIQDHWTHPFDHYRRHFEGDTCQTYMTLDEWRARPPILIG